MLRPPQGDEAIVVTHALRTPIGKYLGAFADLTAADLGAGLVAELLARSGVGGADVGEVIMGNGRQAGGGPNVSRQIAYRAGIAQETCAWTVNMACGSGLKSILLGAEAIALGRADIVVAGGVESMSGLPFFLPKFRTGYRLGHADVVEVADHVRVQVGLLGDEDRHLPAAQRVADHPGHHAALADASLVPDDEAAALLGVEDGQRQRIDLLG